MSKAKPAAAAAASSSAAAGAGAGAGSDAKSQQITAALEVVLAVPKPGAALSATAHSINSHAFVKLCGGSAAAPLPLAVEQQLRALCDAQAKAGNASALNNLAWLNLFTAAKPAQAAAAAAGAGGAAADWESAVALFRKAAAAGCTNVAVNAAVCVASYGRDEKTALGELKALSDAKSAAPHAPNAMAVLNRARMAENGLAGVERSDAAALALYQAAADMTGAAYAQSAAWRAANTPAVGRAWAELGFFHSRGLGGGAVDDAAAVAAWQKGADLGNATAQANLALMYEGGHGVAKDKATAMRWFHTAAANGSANAQRIVDAAAAAAPAGAAGAGAAGAAGGDAAPSAWDIAFGSVSDAAATAVSDDDDGEGDGGDSDAEGEQDSGDDDGAMDDDDAPKRTAKPAEFKRNGRK